MLILLLLLAASLAYSQAADLSGVVQDPSGAPVPHAVVTVLNADTRLRRSVQTNAEGYYSLGVLPPGRYRLSVEARGFQHAVHEGVTVQIGQSARIDFTLEIAVAGQSITVAGDGAPVRSESAAVSTVINRQFLDVLPLNGRSFQTLIALSPGVVMTKATFGEQGQFSVNGQRANANYFTVDGVSANTGVSAGLTLVQGASGSLPGLGSTGGTNTLVSVESMQEFRVQTSTYAPEYGRMPGAQISILTRSGTNQLHGSLFNFFRNNALDAADWFANAERLPEPALRQNNFGAVIGGPVMLPRLYPGRDRTFFFVSYEGLRLRQPQVRFTDVPSLRVRTDAPQRLHPYLNAFPLPNREGGRVGLAPFVASYTDSSRLDATSVRGDHLAGERLSLFGRVNVAPSTSITRLTALSNPTDTIAKTITFTAGATGIITPSVVNDVRLNVTDSTGESSSRLDSFGGAQPLPASQAFPSFVDPRDSFFGFFLQGGIGTGYYLGKNVANRQRQYNVVQTLSVAHGAHQLKFGIDVRQIRTYNGTRAYDQIVSFANGFAAISGMASSVVVEAQDAGSIKFLNVSAYAQDALKLRPHLTVTYGLRWEVNPAPAGGGNHELYTFENSADPKHLRLAPPGTPFFHTTWKNIAPRLGVAWHHRAWTFRGGFGVFYDLGTGLLGQSVASFPYYRQRYLLGAIPFPLAEAIARPPEFTVQPPVASIYGAARNLQLPATLQWNATIERQLSTNDSITLSYVAAAGRRLLRMDYFVNPNQDFTYAYLLQNTAFSDFHSLQAQFQHRMAHSLQALASYTWGHSLDNASTDSASHLLAQQIDPKNDRGPSDFDIRQTLSAAVTYELPAPRLPAKWTRAPLSHWAVDAVVAVRSATPVDVTFARDLGFGLYSFRPDAVPGVPAYLEDARVAGGRRFNTDAFELQADFPGRQGTLGRNVMRGFPLRQLNLSIRRQFRIVENAKLEFRGELFNATNTPNFADPTGTLLSPQFGYSTSMLGRSLGRGGVNGGLNPLYQIGGPRSIQLALRLVY